MFEVGDDGVRGHRRLAAQAADHVSLVLDQVLHHAIGADFVPGLGQIDEVVVHSTTENLLQFRIVPT